MKITSVILFTLLILLLSPVSVLYAQGSFDEADGYRNQSIVLSIDYRPVPTHDGAATTVALQAHINPEIVAMGNIPDTVVVVLSEEDRWTPAEAVNIFQQASGQGELVLNAPSNVYSPDAQRYQAALMTSGQYIVDAIDSLQSSADQQIWEGILEHLGEQYLLGSVAPNGNQALHSLAMLLGLPFSSAFAETDGSFDIGNVFFQAGVGVLAGGVTGATVTAPAGGLGAGPMALAGGVGGLVKGTCEETWDVAGPPVEAYAQSVFEDACEAISGWFCRIKSQAIQRMTPRWQ